MAQIGVREEDIFLVLKHISVLAPFFHIEMEFFTIGTITEAFHCAIKLEVKLKVKGWFYSWESFLEFEDDKGYLK